MGKRDGLYGGPIFRTWCPDAGQSATKGYLELGALDAPCAAQIHAQRMTDSDWAKAKHGARGEDPWVYIMVAEGQDANNRWIALKYVVRRRMQPVFEVVL